MIGIEIKCSNCQRQSFEFFGEDRIYRCENCSHELAKVVFGCGYVYFLTNPTMPGLYKIGFTTNSITERLKNLSSATGVPRGFSLEFYIKSIAPEDDEKKIHTHLGKYRINKDREFFQIDTEGLVEMIISLGFTLIGTSKNNDLLIDQTLRNYNSRKFSKWLISMLSDYKIHKVINVFKSTGNPTSISQKNVLSFFQELDNAVLNGLKHKSKFKDFICFFENGNVPIEVKSVDNGIIKVRNSKNEVISYEYYSLLQGGREKLLEFLGSVFLLLEKENEQDVLDELLELIEKSQSITSNNNPFSLYFR